MASSPEIASEIMLKEFEKPAVLNTATRAGYAKQFYDNFTGTNANATINQRSTNARMARDKQNNAYGGPVIDSINYTRNAVKAYNNANNANKYISSTNSNSMEKAINVIINLLEAITGNTASTSNKLDMLENLKKSNIVKGGDTTNNIISNSGKNAGSATDLLDPKSGKKVSRNQKIAERIALGA
jgi:hypothetical protein